MMKKQKYFVKTGKRGVSVCRVMIIVFFVAAHPLVVSLTINLNV